MNLFVGGSVRVPFNSGEVTLRVETDYPWDGKVSFRLESKSPVHFALRVRKPGWCTQVELMLNGVASNVKPDDFGYWTFDRDWKDGDRVSLALDMPVCRMLAHPNIATCRGKVALQRGPLVYGFEGLDNNSNARVTFGADPKFNIEHQPDLLGGVTVIRGLAANGQPIQAIPFYALANRGKTTQEVWVEQPSLKLTDDWWLGALYRTMPPK